MRTCGGCTMCCKLLGITELSKPPDRWCEHCDIGKGCKIYEGRPESCRNFECLWLQNEVIPEEDRPDSTGVVMFCPEGGETATIQVHVDPRKPDNWKKGSTGTVLRTLAGHFPVLVSIGDKRKFIGTEEMARDVQVKMGPGAKLDLE